MPCKWTTLFSISNENQGHNRWRRPVLFWFVPFIKWHVNRLLVKFHFGGMCPCFNPVHSIPIRVTTTYKPLGCSMFSRQLHKFRRQVGFQTLKTRLYLTFSYRPSTSPKGNSSKYGITSVNPPIKGFRFKAFQTHLSAF